MLLSCLLFAGCGFVQDEGITGSYRLIAVDVDEQMSICYDLGDGNAVGRINETVFSYGFDHRYIVARQHPAEDRSITNYYYLDMTKDSKHANPSDSVTGALDEENFSIATRQLSLPPFSRTLKHLE
jgi:hypothetical protein